MVLYLWSQFQQQITELFSKHQKPEFREKTLLRFELRVEGCNIRKCTWRLLRKEDYLEDLQKVNSSELVVAPSKSTGLTESTMDEQNANFFLGKMFHNIKRGLCLCVLALMSMMQGLLYSLYLCEVWPLNSTLQQTSLRLNYQNHTGILRKLHLRSIHNSCNTNIT